MKQRAVALGTIGALFVITTAVAVVRAMYFNATHYRAGNVPDEVVNELFPKDVPVSALIPPAIRLYDPLRYGGATSVISVIEYGDYECEYCRAMHDVIADVLPLYNGTVRFVFRDLPIEDAHGNAMPAAVFARCAGQQGKFWDAHDALMGSALNERTYRQTAERLGLDASSLAACRNNPEMEAAIRRDVQEARADGIKGVPLLFVGRTAYDHYLTTEELRDAIQSAISSL